MKNIVTSLVLILLLMRCPAPVLAQRLRPNIILIVLDDLDYFDVGAYGAADVLTPNLDTLASQGMMLTQYYAAAPVCSPSRATMLTGQPASTFGFNKAFNDRIDRRGIPAEFETLPEMLSDYDTAHVGKWHVGMAREEFRPEYRFDHSTYISRQFYFDPEVSQDGGEPIILTGDYATTYAANQTIQYIDTLSQPYFISVQFMSPHKPLHVPPDFDNACCGFDLDSDWGKKAAMIYDVDEQIWRIVTAVGDNTLIIVSSDNGGVVDFSDRSGRWLRDGKGSVYEGGIRVPFIAWWPGIIPAGTVNDSLVSSLDMLPTLATLAEVDTPDTPGLSLVNILTTNTTRTGYPLLAWEMKRAGKYHPDNTLDFAVREGDWKLVESDGELQLFNIADDSAESNDLAGDYPELADQLYEAYLHWRAQVGDLSVQADEDTIPFEVRHDFHNGDFSAVVRFEAVGSVTRAGSWQLVTDGDGVMLQVEGDEGGSVTLASGPIRLPATVMFTATGYKSDYNHFRLYVNGRLVNEAFGEDSVVAVASNDSDVVISGDAEVLRLSVLTLQPNEVDWLLPFAVYLPMVVK